jgi:pimeloyl-ACP methyl ester carboxylesterase
MRYHVLSRKTDLYPEPAIGNADNRSHMIIKKPEHLQATLIILMLGLQACSISTKPDLERLYQQNREVNQPPVVLIHGLMGSRLADRESGEEVWVGNLSRLLFSDYEELALEIDPDSLLPKPSPLITSGLLDKVVGKDFYAGITQTLESAGGYHYAEIGSSQAPGARNYYVFTYDWRQDNVQTAKKLSQFIEQIRLDYADTGLKVDLVAHSMGGLIARYYLRYGESDALDDNNFDINLHGAERVRRVVLLGTPNLGSAGALHSFIEGFKVGTRTMPTETVVTMPSTYQLFPHALSDWIVTAKGKTLERDLFDVNIWRRFEWSIFDPEVRDRVIKDFENEADGHARLDLLERYFEKHLERARRFVWSLTVPLPEQPYKLIVLGGDCELTPARLVVEEVDGVSEIRLWPKQIKHPVAAVDYDRIMLEPGDGTVTKASLLARESLDPSVPRHQWVSFPLDYPIFLCEAHTALTGNVTFQDSLLHTLLSLDVEY